jgi:uncharacterized protein
MRIFLDTNVLISAVATRGLCTDVMREVLTSHELVVCETLIIEITRNLKNKIKLSQELIDEFITFLLTDSVFVTPLSSISLNGIDKNDCAILDCAIEGKAQIFVTGDKELLNLQKVDELIIISPREFWERSKR